MSFSPLVSIILLVKNGMPYLPQAIASLKAQTYRNFELIVQDGESTDGTLEFLKTVEEIPTIKIESIPDSEHHPYNRAISRCSGEIIGSLADDDLLEPEALATVVDFFAQQPNCAAVYSACKMIDKDGGITSVFEPESFDPLNVMECKLVPPLAVSFFSRSLCEGAFGVHEDHWACYDYALWLRLSHLPIVKISTVLGSVRVSEESNTCQADRYELMCNRKISILKHYLSQYEPLPLIEEVQKHCVAGIYTWAAESMLWIPTGTLDWFNFYYEKALALYPTSERLQNIKLRQELTQTRNELYQLRDEHNQLRDEHNQLWNIRNQVQDKLDRTTEQLERSQTELQQDRATINHLQETIAAMESSKFWQLRNRWMKLKGTDS